MTIISKATAFPKSVRPGIPKLGKKPEGWLREPLSQHLKEVLRPIELEDESEYRLVTVKRSRGGVVEREVFLGRDIAVKSQFALKAGDFLISKRQIVHGACGVVPHELDGTVVSNEYSVLNSLGTLDLEFLKYLSHSSYFQETCFHSSIGVHVEKMIFKLEDWLKWQFDLPNVTEQRRIAEILSTWDKAIAVQEKMVANAKALKKALMQQLLTGKKRLPGFKGEWKMPRIEEACETYSGGTPSRLRPEYFGDDVPWIKSGELNQIVVRTTEESISHLGLQNSAAKIVPAGTVLIAMYGATAGVVAETAIEAAINQAILAIIPNKGLDKGYLKQILTLQMEQVSSLTQGGQPNLNAYIIGRSKLPLPSLDEQQRIAEVLGKAATEVAIHERLLTVRKFEKSALMQQLLTGKRRVKMEVAA